MHKHCVKSVGIWSFSGPNAAKYGSEKSPNRDTFYVVEN